MASENNGSRRYLLIALTLVILVLGGVGATTAALQHKTDGARDTFSAVSAVNPVIHEEFTQGGTGKQHVTVQVGTEADTGSYYVRAAVVITLADDAGNVLAKVPEAGTDYTILFGDGWTQEADGFWYYDDAVPAGAFTSDLIVSCRTLNAEYRLQADIAAQTIQAEPAGAAADAWNR